MHPIKVFFFTAGHRSHKLNIQNWWLRKCFLHWKWREEERLFGNYAKHVILVDLVEDVVIHPHRTVIDHRCGPAQRKSVQSKMTKFFDERWPRLRTSKMPQQYNQCCVSTLIPGPTSVGTERLADDNNILVMSGAIDDIRGRLESRCEGLAAQHTVPI